MKRIKTKLQLIKENEKLKLKLQRLQDSLQVYQHQHCVVLKHPYIDEPNFIAHIKDDGAYRLARELLKDGVFNISYELDKNIYIKKLTMRLTVQK